MISKGAKLVILLLLILASTITFFVIFPYTIVPTFQELVFEGSIYLAIILVFGSYNPRFSKKTVRKFIGLLVIISIIVFFLQFHDEQLTTIVQLMAELVIAVTSYMFISSYYVREISLATNADLDQLFDQGSGELVYHQNTTNPSHEYLKLTLDRKHIEVYPATAIINNLLQDTRKGLVPGSIASLLFTLLIIWIQHTILNTDLVPILFIYVTLVIAEILFVILASKNTKIVEKTIETRRLVEFRKNNPNLEINCRVPKAQLPENPTLQDMKLSVPAVKLSDELFFTSLDDEIKKNKDKIPTLIRFFFALTSKIIKHPPSIALNGESENVQIFDTPVPDEVSKKFITKTILIFSLFDKQLLEAFHQNLLQWSAQPI